MRRTLTIALMSLGLLLGFPAAASAVVVMYDKNTYGSYDCQLTIPGNHQYVMQGCNVFDDECDGYGVYVGMAIRLSGFSAPSGRTRVTPNAGGCGHGKYFDKKRKFDSGIGTRDITHVYTSLCVDVPMGSDYCYSGTNQKYFLGWYGD